MGDLVDKVVVTGVALLLWAAILAGGSMVLGACDDQTGGYPTPMVRGDAR